jgi:hypothetical protein
MAPDLAQAARCAQCTGRLGRLSLACSRIPYRGRVGGIHTAGAPHVRAQVDPGVHPAAVQVTQVGDGIPCHLHSCQVAEDPGMHPDAGVCTMISCSDLHGIVGNDRTVSTEKDDPDI